MCVCVCVVLIGCFTYLWFSGPAPLHQAGESWRARGGNCEALQEEEEEEEEEVEEEEEDKEVGEIVL